MTYTKWGEGLCFDGRQKKMEQNPPKGENTRHMSILWKKSNFSEIPEKTGFFHDPGMYRFRAKYVSENRPFFVLTSV
jgi:hypothetical protein